MARVMSFDGVCELSLDSTISLSIDSINDEEKFYCLLSTYLFIFRSF